MTIDFSKLTGFDWDRGNREKSWHKHRVNFRECEEVFFNKPLLVHEDAGHSRKEARYYALGVTNNHRRIFLSFTVRGHLVRVISARDQSRKERTVYEASKRS